MDEITYGDAVTWVEGTLVPTPTAAYAPWPNSQYIFMHDGGLHKFDTNSLNQPIDLGLYLPSQAELYGPWIKGGDRPPR